MKRPITLFTSQWADLSISEICKLAPKMGYEGIELATWGKQLNPKKAVNDPEYIKNIKKDFKDNGLGLWAVGGHMIGKLVGDEMDTRYNSWVPDRLEGKYEEIREWAVERMKDLIKGADNLGVKIITGLVGSPIWNYWYSLPKTTEDMTEKGYQTIKKRWTPLFDEMDKYGIKFGLEIHATDIAYDYYTFVRLLETFEYRETLGINLDPSHLAWQGIKPHLVIRNLPDRIYHVHLKDVEITLDGLTGILCSHMDFGNSKRGWNFRSLGRGQIDFEVIIRELNEIGYEGPLSVEWEDNGMERIRGATEAAEFVKKVNITPSPMAWDGCLTMKEEE